MHIGQPEVSALVAVREFFVIDSERVQNRGVQVVNMDWLFDDVVTEIVSRTVHGSRLNTTTGHPFRVASRVMIATIIGLSQLTL